MVVYLDNNATSPLRPAVKAAYVAALDVYGNASSVHSAGRDARHALDTARRKVADSLGVRSEQVVFTSGGTEADVMAIKGVVDPTVGATLFSTGVEHPALYDTLHALTMNQDVRAVQLAVDVHGRVDIAHLDAQLAAYPSGNRLVTLMLANNETGVIQDAQAIAAVCRKHGVLLHLDAVQAYGKMPLNFAELGCDMLSLSFHKCGGPKGVGALVLKGGIELDALMSGGGQERNRRSGTENIPAIVAAGVCVDEMLNGMDVWAHVADLRDTLEAGVKALKSDAIVVGEEVERMSHTSSFILPGLNGETLVMAFDMEGVCISQGSACSSGRVEPSRVLKNLGYDEAKSLSGIRVSLGWQTCENDVETFLDVCSKVFKRLEQAR